MIRCIECISLNSCFCRLAYFFCSKYLFICYDTPLVVSLDVLVRHKVHESWHLAGFWWVHVHNPSMGFLTSDKGQIFLIWKKSYNNKVYLAPISIKRMLINSKLNSLFDSTHFHTEGCHLCRWLPLWLVWQQTDELGAAPGGLAPSDPREPPHTPGYFWWVPSGRWRWHFCGKMAPCSEWLPGAGGMEILHHIFTLLQLLTMH